MQCMIKTVCTGGCSDSVIGIRSITITLLLHLDLFSLRNGQLLRRPCWRPLFWENENFENSYPSRLPECCFEPIM
jgi:hypothetical protein